MAKVYDDELAKETSQQRAMEYNGYKKCNSCGEMFKPSIEDPGQFICDSCLEKAYNKF